MLTKYNFCANFSPVIQYQTYAAKISSTYVRNARREEVLSATRDYTKSANPFKISIWGAAREGINLAVKNINRLIVAVKVEKSNRSQLTVFLTNYGILAEFCDSKATNQLGR